MHLDKIIQMAKEHILKHGRHMPEIIVEFDGQEMRILAVPDIVNSDSNIEKQHNFFTVGRMLGEKEPDANIKHIVFIVEAWLSRQPHNAPRTYDLPSQDPNRKECLLITTLDIVTKDDGEHTEQGMHLAEMIRDGSGNLIDLLSHDTGIGEVKSKLLLAFLAGFSSAKLTKQQREDMIASVLGADATGEEVQRFSKMVYGHTPYMAEVFPANDIPRKRTSMQYRKTKKRRK